MSIMEQQAVIRPMRPSTTREGFFEAEASCPDAPHRHMAWGPFRLPGAISPATDPSLLPYELREKWDHPWLVTMM